MSFFSNNNNSKVSELEILNSGLFFAMEFGENWLQPIESRLLSKYNFLSTEQLNKYNEVCREAMFAGHKCVHDILEKVENENQTIKENILKQQMINFLLKQYSWINEKNLKKIFSQSCYYAYKEGLDKSIV